MPAHCGACAPDAEQTTRSPTDPVVTSPYNRRLQPFHHTEIVHSDDSTSAHQMKEPHKKSDDRQMRPQAASAIVLLYIPCGQKAPPQRKK
jgi:hypothetical protein